MLSLSKLHYKKILLYEKSWDLNIFKCSSINSLEQWFSSRKNDVSACDNAVLFLLHLDCLLRFAPVETVNEFVTNITNYYFQRYTLFLLLLNA